MRPPVVYRAVTDRRQYGRALLGRIDGEQVTLEEMHRFPNEPVQLVDGLYWDVLSIFREVKQGLAKAAAAEVGRLESIGVDSWAVDFALLDREGALVSNPLNHRDPRMEGMVE